MRKRPTLTTSISLYCIISAVLISAAPAFCQDGQDGDVALIKQQLEELKKKVGEVEDLKKRVTVLEEKVRQQQAIIKQQRDMLRTVSEIAPEIKKALAPKEPTVLVKRFILKGAHLFTAKDFAPILSKYRNKELTMTQLKKAAEEITNLYRRRGYISSLAYAPGQKISDNTVEFRIVEGRIGKIDIEEGKYYDRRSVSRGLLLREGQIVNYKKLEKNIKQINKQPDRTVKAVLMPGKEEGTSDILLKVKENRPDHFYVGYNNRGTKYTGKVRYDLGYVNNNLLGNDDILSVKLRIGENYDEVYTGIVDYNFPVSRYDTRLGVYGAFSHADIGKQFQILTPEGKATIFGAYITHPLFDKDFLYPVTLNLSGTVSGGIDSLSVYNKILGKETSHDELRVLKAGISFDEKDSLGRTFNSNEVRFGLSDFLGSMDDNDASASRIDAGGKFTKYVGSLTRITRLPLSSLFISSIKGQLSDSPLVNSEQLSFGGADSIRGFPENDYLADYGWMSTFEVRTPAFIFPRGLNVPYDKKMTPLRKAMQFTYFVDFGRAYLKKPRVGEKQARFLIGGGLGLRFDFSERLRGRIDWGFPLGNEEPSDNSSSTVYLDFQWDFW